MNNYTIVLHNKKEDLWEEKTVERHTFPEAARDANIRRLDLGYEWNIVSIHKNEKRSKKCLKTK